MEENTSNLTSPLSHPDPKSTFLTNMPREPLLFLSGSQLTISIYKPTIFDFRKVETKSDLNAIFNNLLNASL